MRARGTIPTTLEAALDGPNIPTSVYTRLVDGVNKHLPTFHRYLKLRQKMMGVSELHYYDLYAPLVASVDLTYTPEEAQKHVLAALKPLGTDYTSVVAKAFNERWIDLLPNEGKRSGAYSNGGAYDVHPFMLLNYNGKYTDVSTLAHELGHTMHSYYSNKMQPFATASYSLFVAEVASTFNEALLIDYMLKNIKDDATKLSLLGNYLEGIKSTVFRQTQFAEFEWRAHEMAEKGQPITGEALDKLYAEMTRKYYGHDKGVTVVDDYIAHEWSFMPHFYRAYYVFQYATSFTASAALSEKVMAGDPEAIKRYLAFLGSGGSKYPIRPAQGRGRRHDHRRTARADDEEDESGDGRNGEAAGGEEVTRPGSFSAPPIPSAAGARRRAAGATRRTSRPGSTNRAVRASRRARASSRFVRRLKVWPTLAGPGVGLT